jgi:hypothetical protein
MKERFKLIDELLGGEERVVTTLQFESSNLKPVKQSSEQP